MAQQAQDTFVVELATGPLKVSKGEVFADNHPAVKLDDGRGLLFKPLDLGEPEPPVKRPRGRPRKNPVAAEGNGEPDGDDSA